MRTRLRGRPADAPTGPEGDEALGAVSTTTVPSSSTSSSMKGLASSLVIILANLGSGIITARLLGPEGRAVVITATVWLIVGSWASLISLRQSVQFHLAPTRDRPTSAAMAASGLLLATVLAVAGGGIAQAAVGLVISDPVLLTPTRVMLLAILVVVWYEILCGILLGRHRVGTALAIRTAQAVVYLVLVGAVALVGTLTALAALACLAGSFAVPAVAGLAMAVRTGGFSTPRLRYVRRMLGYGARIYPGTLASLTNARIDLLVVPAVLTPAAVGYYGVASNTSGIMQQLLGNFALVLFPAMVASDPARRQQLLERTVRLLLVLGLVGALVGAVLAGPVIRLLYGSAFDATVPLLQVLLVAAVPYAVMGVLASGLAASAMPVRASVVNLVGVPATAGGLLLLVPLMGAEGAALTSLAAYALCMVVGIVLCRGKLLRVRALLSPRAYRTDVTTLAVRVRRKVEVKKTD